MYGKLIGIHAVCVMSNALCGAAATFDMCIVTAEGREDNTGGLPARTPDQNCGSINPYVPSSREYTTFTCCVSTFENIKNESSSRSS